MSKSEDRLSTLQDRIGYRFTDRERLRDALTHSSSRDVHGGDYERLEFLGDRVLGLAIAQYLFQNHPLAPEGELSVRLNALVSAEGCAKVADEIGLGEFVRTGSDLKNMAAKRLKSVRADVVESLIAAIYLDGGLEAAAGFIERFWKDMAENEDAGRRDAKTELQEWSHANGSGSPSYTISDQSGPDHDPTFVVEVSVEGYAPETGSGRSKRSAEQKAAERILLREGVWQQDIPLGA